MGYTTDFSGEFTITPALTSEHKAYLGAFAAVRHMKRDAKKAELLPDPIREAAGLPVGPEGCYYVGSANDGNYGQSNDPSVIDHNSPPGTTGWGAAVDPGAESYAQPGLWCQWEPNEDGTAIRWDGGEKFYEYVAWIEYLLDHFLTIWGYTLNGSVVWQGEESIDMGIIKIENNVVAVGRAEISYRFDH